MKVKIVNPDTAIGLMDPRTKRRPFIDSGTGKPILSAVDVPETAHWLRRVRDREIEHVDQRPTGLEPVTPIITRTR